MKKELTKTKEELHTSASTMNFQKQEKSKAENDAQRLRNELERLSASLSDEERRAQVQRREIEQLRTNVENQKLVVKRLESERAEQIDQITELERALSLAHDSNDPTLADRHARAVDELNTIRKQSQTLAAQCDTARHELEEEQRRFKTAQAQISELVTI